MCVLIMCVYIWNKNNSIYIAPLRTEFQNPLIPVQMLNAKFNQMHIRDKKTKRDKSKVV